MNPTCAVLEERIAKLEGGAASLAGSSGQAASMMAIQNILTIVRTGQLQKMAPLEEQVHQVEMMSLFLVRMLVVAMLTV